MATYKASQADLWVRKCQKRMDIVSKESVARLVDASTKTAPGKSRGGTVKPGFIPVRDGFLAGSLVSELNGGRQSGGNPSGVKLNVAGMKGGDSFVFGWTANYARVQHYKGWLWAEIAASSWPSIVKGATAEAILRAGK